MQLILQGKLENIFRSKDFSNKKTGEESRGKWQLQFMEEQEGADGVQLVIHKVSVPDNQMLALREKVGEIVQINVRAFINQGRVAYYGV